ncbi:MAG: hypothetical protein ACK2T0_15225 [Anaerolineales bacterium]
MKRRSIYLHMTHSKATEPQEPTDLGSARLLGEWLAKGADHIRHFRKRRSLRLPYYLLQRGALWIESDSPIDL